MEFELLKEVISLGVGCVLALVIFIMYRQDKKATEARLTGLLEKDQKTREDNTKVLAELYTLVSRMNGNKK